MITVDRIEGERAILDIDGELVEIPLAALPPGTAEGAGLALVAASVDDVRAEGAARLARMTARSDLPDDIDL